MTVHDRIRLIDRLRESPATAGLFYLRDSARELRSKLTSEPDRRFDLHSPDRDAFHVDSKRHAEPAAVRDQLGGGRQGVLIGGLQRVGSVREVILDPSRHLDT